MTPSTQPETGSAGVEDRPDAYAGVLPEPLPIETLRQLSVLSPWRSAAQIALQWGLIVAAILLCRAYWHPLLYVATVVVIGSRQHALAILVHEGAHYRLFKNKRLNDWVSEFFLAWPLLGTMRTYRMNHFAHHRFVNTGDDPDWVRKQTAEWRFPQTGGRFFSMLLRDVLGVNTFQAFGRLAAHSKLVGQSGASAGFKAARWGTYAAVAGLLTYLHGWPGFLLYWLIPGLTWLKLALRLRSIAEHFAIPDDHPYTATRTVLATWLDRLLIAPMHINYHLEHHLYPSVPFYRLPDLHRTMMAMPGFRDRAHLTAGYWGVVRECLGKRTPPATEQPT